MAENRNPGADRASSDDELAWLAGHVSELRQSVSEHRIRDQVLWIGLTIGLVVHVVGYLLKSNATGEPFAVLADLLYTLGWGLWTGVVVVAMVELIPAAKEKQISRALDAYESALRSRPRTTDEGRHAECRAFLPERMVRAP